MGKRLQRDSKRNRLPLLAMAAGLLLLLFAAASHAMSIEIPSTERLYNDLVRSGWSTTGEVSDEISKLAQERSVVETVLGQPQYILYFLNGSMEFDFSYTQILRQRLTSTVIMGSYVDTLDRDPRIKNALPDLLYDSQHSALTLNKNQLVRRYGQPSNLRDRKLDETNIIEYWYRVGSEEPAVVNCVTFWFNEETGQIDEIALSVRKGELLKQWLKWPSINMQLNDLPVVSAS